jgi:hypothetical protein
MGARRHDVAMRGFLLLCSFFLILPVQAAKQSSTPNRFGAIAYHQASKSWGISYDTARARDAEVAALKQCGQRECVVIHKFKNGCAALAAGDKTSAAASGATRDEAETKALKRCGASCSALAWGCTR